MVSFCVKFILTSHFSEKYSCSIVLQRYISSIYCLFIPSCFYYVRFLLDVSCFCFTFCFFPFLLISFCFSFCLSSPPSTISPISRLLCYFILLVFSFISFFSLSFFFCLLFVCPLSIFVLLFLLLFLLQFNQRFQIILGKSFIFREENSRVHIL